MASHDKRIRITIERYPDDMEETFSYGCPELDLMGYCAIESLMVDVSLAVRKEIK